MKVRILILAIALGCALASSARATSLVRMTLSQLAQASSTIVEGEVVLQEAQWNSSHTRIMTYTTVRLEKALKGQAPSTLTIEQLGGTIGNFHVHVPGTAFLRPQGQYVLFLEAVAGKPQTYHTVGMMQGAFRVYREGNSGRPRVVLPLGALDTGNNSRTLAQSPTLGEFKTTISDALAAPIIIPAGTAMPVVIESTQFRGTGQAVVIAHTTSDLFPSKAVVIPAGSQVVGTAQRQGMRWKIYWNSVSVRGQQVIISGASEVAGSLKGHAMVVEAK